MRVRQKSAASAADADVEGLEPDAGTALKTGQKASPAAGQLSGIAKDQEYSLVLGDDKLAVFLNDGSIRELTDEEYDIVFVTVPADRRKLDYEVYGAYSQDTPFEEYFLLFRGNTEKSETVKMREGTKAMYVRVNNIVGSYQYSVETGVRLHLDRAAEQEKEEALRPDHENRLVNFSYLRSLYTDPDGEERNDCMASAGNYEGSYGSILAERDLALYGEYLMRDYSDVWLRNSATTVKARADLYDFSGNKGEGFTASAVVSGTIKGDQKGELKRFSLYAVIDNGLKAVLDTGGLLTEGIGIFLNGEEALDFSDHVTFYEGTYDGEPMVAADFDFAEMPLEISEEVWVTMEFPVFLSYTSYVEYGEFYTLEGYLMVHDEEAGTISGPALISDHYDIDGNGMTEEMLAFSRDDGMVRDGAVEWREYVSKYVKSAYSEDYVTDTAVKLYREEDGESQREKSRYSYRLDFGLGSSNAKNLVFFDRLEQGARIAVNGGQEGEYREEKSEWQGTFLGVDTYHAENMGMEATVYYSEDPGQVLDLGASGWTTVCPKDRSKVKTVAVALDTSGMSGGLMKTKQTAYIRIDMQAPDDGSLVGKNAVNQYEIQYDAYGLSSAFEKTYRLPSSETRVQLLDSVGKIILQKVDGDSGRKAGPDGSVKYTPVAGGLFQVYDEAGNALFDVPRSPDPLGRIVLERMPYGTYYYEEIEAPLGYRKEEGRKPIEADGTTELFYMINERVPGEVTLTKRDGDDPSLPPLSGAGYELYKSNGEQVFTDEENRYQEAGTRGYFETGGDGTITISGLPWGNYYFKEVKAPLGYLLSKETVPFFIGKSIYDKETDSIRTSVETKNEEDSAAIRLKKTDATSGKPVKGAVYSLYREKRGEETADVLVSSGNKTNAAGEIEVSGLKFGTYYFVEKRNAGGYKLPKGEAAETERVTLDETTVGQLFRLTHRDERVDGQVCLLKKDDAGQIVGGAEYGLWYRTEEAGSDGAYVLKGTYVTDPDPGSITYGEIHVDGLSWGEYYFLETKAPDGYEKSLERVEFTIDQESVQNTVFLETEDQRKKGSVRLTKVDREEHSTLLSGAVYELYRMDGRKCVLGQDYSLPEGVKEICTGQDGSVLISNIRQGGYYLLEVKAPPSYSLSSDPIRFSISRENCERVQELTAEDEKGKAVIRIRKEVDAVYGPFGAPTFLFRVSGGGRTYIKSITLSEAQNEGSVSLSVEHGHTYTVQELPVSRYRLEQVIPVKNAVLDGEGALADLTVETEAEVKFVNKLGQYEKFSHTSAAINLAKAKAQFTGIRVEYTGPEIITEDTKGYDRETGTYVFSDQVLKVTAFYDDGKAEVIPWGSYSVSPESADGTQESYTGTVTCTIDGMTRTDTFQVQIKLPKPIPRCQVTFELNGGGIIPDGGDYAQETLHLQMKQGQSLEVPVHDPVKEGYGFTGWYKDAALTEEASFPAVVEGDTVFYARWNPGEVKVRYAVAVYGIGQDTDPAGKPVGLTFGPASGRNLVGSYISHSPSAGQLCIHDMTWQEIVAQSKKDPSVFRECVEHGCSHAVELTVSGKLAEGATSFPDMTGDGVSVLEESVAAAYRCWNRAGSVFFPRTTDKRYPKDYEVGTNTGGWPDSALRNMLNGVVTENMLAVTNKDNGFEAAKLDEKNALINCFPSVLKYAIVPKAVKSDTVHSDREGNNATTYDRLWICSGKETFVSNTETRDIVRPNEGAMYDRFIGLENAYAKNRGYNENGLQTVRWTRSQKKAQSYYMYIIDNNWLYKNPYTSLGVSPCFCLPGPEE